MSENNGENNSKSPSKFTLPVPQVAQICAWCHEYIFSHQETTIYSGDDCTYLDWMVHLDCDELFSGKIKTK